MTQPILVCQHPDVHALSRWRPPTRLHEVLSYGVNGNGTLYKTQTNALHLNPGCGPLSQSESLVITAPLLSSDNFLMDSASAPRQTPVGPREERGRPAFCISVIIPFAHAVLTFCLAPRRLRRTPPPGPPRPPATNAGAATSAQIRSPLSTSMAWKMNEGASVYRVYKWPWECKSHTGRKSAPRWEIKVHG